MTRTSALAVKAPDIGAYEVGQPIPTYGPRGNVLVERLNAMRRGIAEAPKHGDRR